MTDQLLRVLVVDDEPLGCARIIKLLKAESGVEVVGTAENGEDAIVAIRELRPDLVFLDVQMPRKTGIDVLREIGPEKMPATIFVTAFDQYALQAFDAAAIDYLTKPYDNERFAQAFQRAKRAIKLEEKDKLWSQLTALLHPAAADGQASRAEGGAGSYLQRVAVKSRGKTRLIPVGEIDYFQASEQYVDIFTGGSRYTIRETLQELEGVLDPASFIRTHRSVIVRIDAIDLLLRAEGGDYDVQLKSGARLKLSRYRREEVERRLGVSS